MRHGDDASARGTDVPAAAFERADAICPFGPSFFLGHLAKFVRDRCPNPAEQLPVVHLSLSDGEVLELCHVLSITPRWVVLAVHDTSGPGERMNVELVPFELIRRIRISVRPAEGAGIGFAQARPPEVITPANLLEGVMAAPEHPLAGSATPLANSPE